MMHITDSIKCIYFNLLSSFYIAVNIMFPYYNEEILNLQYKTIEHINEDIIFASNSRKRKRFNLFIENLINKNNELIEKIKRQEEEDNNINNYEKIDQELRTFQENETDTDTDDSQENCKED
jgi:hypothetical protein